MGENGKKITGKRDGAPPVAILPAISPVSPVIAPFMPSACCTGRGGGVDLYHKILKHKIYERV